LAQDDETPIRDQQGRLHPLLCPQERLLSLRPQGPMHTQSNNPQNRRHFYEGARDLARELSLTDAFVDSQRRRTKVEMLFAHLKRILKIDRLRPQGPNGAKDEFHLAATAQNLRKLAELIPQTA